MKKTYPFPEKLDISVSCASGVESVLKKEIKRLTGTEAPALNGRVDFAGDPASICKLNLSLRTADRVYIKAGEFGATSFDELFDGVKNIPWENFFTEDGNIYVNGNCVKSKLFSISDCQKIVKKAIATRLCAKYGINRLPESGAEYALRFYIRQDLASIYIDTSGAGLHKRGYRDKVGVAPIKETLAAAMLLSSDFYKMRPFADPFCGSGTFLIEGARIALNIAAGIDRKFAFNDWKNFDGRYFDLAYEEAKDGEDYSFLPDIRGFDIDKKAVELTTRHLKRAGLEKIVKAERRSVDDFSPWGDFGTIVTNPPYGERVFGIRQAEECYRALGKVTERYPGWSCFVITPHPAFQKLFGRKCDREKKLYNSEKECRFYYYYGKKEK